MAYRSPYLDLLAEDEKVQNKNEARVLNAMSLINEAPMTVNDLVNEELKRKEDLRKTKKNEEQEDSRIALSDRNTTINENAETRVKENSDRDFWKKRIGERIENVVMGTTAGYKPEGQQPVAAQPAPVPQTPMQQDVRSQGIANPETFAKATGIPNNAPSAPIVEQPAATAPSTQPSIGGPPMTQQEVISAYATDPQIQVMYKQALAALNNDPNFRKYYTDEEVLGIIVKQKTGRDNELARQSLAQGKADIDRQYKQARIDRLKIPKSASIKGPKEWPVALGTTERAQLTEIGTSLMRLDKIGSDLASGQLDPGFINGYGNKIRNILNLRDATDAGSIATVQRELNAIIKQIAGAQVTENELERIKTSMPSTFDDRETMEAFIDILREELAFKNNSILSVADLGKRAPTPMVDRGGMLGPDGKPKTKPAPASDTQASAEEEELMRAAGLL